MRKGMWAVCEIKRGRERERGKDTSRDGVVISRLSRPPLAPRGCPRSVRGSPIARIPLTLPRSPRSPRSVSKNREGEQRGDRVCREQVAYSFSVKGFFEEQVSPSFYDRDSRGKHEGKYERSAREECVPCTRTRQLRARFKVHYARRQERGGETVKKVKRPGTRDF